MDNIKLLDYVIATQISKINKYSGEHTKSILSEDSEQAMSNLIELLKLRKELLKSNSKKRY